MWKIIMLTCLADGRCYQQEAFVPWPRTHSSFEACMERLKTGGQNAEVDAIIPPNTVERYACVQVQE